MGENNTQANQQKDDEYMDGALKSENKPTNNLPLNLLTYSLTFQHFPVNIRQWWGERQWGVGGDVENVLTSKGQ